MPIDGGQRIAGTISRDGTTRFSATDPNTGAPLIGEFVEATVAEVDCAARAAEESAVAFRCASLETRAALLDGIAAAIERRGDALIERAMRETGLPAPRLEMERGRTCGQLRAFAACLREGSRLAPVYDAGDPERTPIPKPDLVRKLIAVGPVAVFGASNFPLAFSVAGGDSAAALGAGCPIIVKAHPAHPGTSELVATAIEDALRATGLPSGVFSLIHGRAHETGGALVDHPAIRAVAFTGSFAGGRALWQRAQARPVPIPVHAEMGSVNPVFVLPGALETRAGSVAEGLASAVCLGVGQFCTNPGIVAWIEGEGADTFLAVLGARITNTEAGTMLHEGIREGYERSLSHLTSLDGVEDLARGPKGGAPCAVSAALHSVDALAFLAVPDLANEVFGPSTLAVIAKDEEELVEVARSLGGQLTATLHGNASDAALRDRLRPILEERAGRLIWNGFPTGVEVSKAMQHGGPWPATTDARATSVGLAAIDRFLRPVCYQGWPE